MHKRSSSIGLSNNHAVSSLGNTSCHVVTAQVGYVNVFFDGTQNNYYNVSAPVEQKKQGQGSYFNDLSNVARMWKSIQSSSVANAVYIEGIGTAREQDDDKVGLAFGAGETGIPERVRASFAMIVEKVKRNIKAGADMPALIRINVFGFSRGAAAARHFVHLVNTQKDVFGPAFKGSLTGINFVGLFDTVAAYRGYESLQLAFKAGYANKVFHLVAHDEYRSNFPLTDISSARALHTVNCTESYRMGYELRIPGAHSDVGGGYLPKVREQRDVIPTRESPTMRAPIYGTKDFVYAQGWYNEQQHVPGTEFRESFAHVREVHGEYYKVALSLMVEQANVHTVTRFPAELTAPPSAPLLAELQASLREFVTQEYRRWTWRPQTEWGEAKAKALRNQFLHLSFEVGSVGGAAVNGPRWVDKGQIEREVLPG